jgi:hypothetical protein
MSEPEERPRSTALDTIFEYNNLPPPPGGAVPLDVKYQARFGDWFVLTKDGWFWLNPHTSNWHECPNGPL